MNKIEKIVYDAVKSNPKIKNIIRNIYQSTFDLLPEKKDFSINTIMVRKGYFFGFHDINPFSINEKFILSNKLEISEEPMRMPEIGDPLTVGYWEDDFSSFISVKQTMAWNYHKGCRLQWVGDKSESFIFNDIVNDHLTAVVYQIGENSFSSLGYPIDTVSHNGKYATSFSYERLNRYMPGYGYLFHDEPFFDEAESDHTGLFIIDIEKKNRKLIISLSQLAKIDHEPTMDGAYHYVTHTEFSPDDRRIAFLHRWTFDDPNKRYTRLVTCKLDGSDIHISATTGMVSHYNWDREHGILAYAQVNGVDGHYIFKNYKMENSIRVAPTLNSDGHQSYVSGTNFFVTDTYPDKWRQAKLYLCNINTGESKLIASLKSPKKFQSPMLEKHWSCDLHPRVSPSGKYVCFDSVHVGKRSLCIMEI